VVFRRSAPSAASPPDRAASRGRSSITRAAARIVLPVAAVGGLAALSFAVALLASGASSSSVGTYAGQVVMAGFVNLRIPLMLRRGLTMIPALIIIAIGMNPTQALVLSQVVLSFGIPFALVPLVILTSRRDVMGCHVNQRLTTIAGGVCVAVIIALNLLLLGQQFFQA